MGTQADKTARDYAVFALGKGQGQTGRAFDQADQSPSTRLATNIVFVEPRA